MKQLLKCSGNDKTASTSQTQTTTAVIYQTLCSWGYGDLPSPHSPFSRNKPTKHHFSLEQAWHNSYVFWEIQWVSLIKEQEKKKSNQRTFYLGSNRIAEMLKKSYLLLPAPTPIPPNSWAISVLVFTSSSPNHCSPSTAPSMEKFSLKGQWRWKLKFNKRDWVFTQP